MIRTILTVCIAGCCLLTTMAARWEFTPARRGAAGPFTFEPLASSASCVVGGAVLPERAAFRAPGRLHPDCPGARRRWGATDNWDMNTLNETGPSAGQFLFRSHETLANGQISVTDLHTGLTRVLPRTRRLEPHGRHRLDCRGKRC